MSAPTVNLGQSVTLTATVTDDTCDGVPNETVTFNGIDQTSGDPTTCTTPADTS